MVPHPGRIREVNSNVAAAVVLAAQEAGLAGKALGSTKAEVISALKAAMWSPPGYTAKSPVCWDGTPPPSQRRTRSLPAGLAQRTPRTTHEPEQASQQSTIRLTRSALHLMPVFGPVPLPPLSPHASNHVRSLAGGMRATGGRQAEAVHAHQVRLWWAQE